MLYVPLHTAPPGQIITTESTSGNTDMSSIGGKEGMGFSASLIAGIVVPSSVAVIVSVALVGTILVIVMIKCNGSSHGQQTDTSHVSEGTQPDGDYSAYSDSVRVPSHYRAHGTSTDLVAVCTNQEVFTNEGYEVGTDPIVTTNPAYGVNTEEDEEPHYEYIL